MAAFPIGVFVRFVVMTGAAVYSNWDTISGQFQRFDEEPDEPIYGYYCQNVFEMKDAAGSFTTRERGMFGIHWVNSTGGDPDYTWTTADYQAVETAVQAMWTALASRISTDYRLVEHRWYAFGPGVISPNPPSRVTTLGSPMAGTSGNVIPHQVAVTVTLRTVLRRHWGRFYFPVGAYTWAAGGQLTSTNTDELAAAARTMLMAPGASQGVVPVVYDRTRKSVLGLSAVEVDSIPDIIRRRRPRTTAYRKIYTS